MTTLVDAPDELLLAELRTRIEGRSATLKKLDEQIAHRADYRDQLEIEINLKRVNLAELQALSRAHGGVDLPAGPRSPLADFNAAVELPDLPDLRELPDLPAVATAVAAAENGTGPLYEAIERIVDALLVKKGVVAAGSD